MACKGRIWDYKYDDILPNVVDLEKSTLLNISPYNKCVLDKCGYFERCYNLEPVAYRNYGLRKENN